MKKNIIRVLFGLLLLCSLLLNAMFLYNGAMDVELSDLEKRYCPTQRAAIKALKEECIELLPHNMDLD